MLIKRVLIVNEKRMIKKDFPQANLTCLMQQDAEITKRPVHGCISRSASGAWRFEQTISTEKRYERNPHLFEGDYINIGRNKEGEIILTFRKIKDLEKDFNPRQFCMGVYNELLRELPAIVND